ncbi:MAG: mechanosensitive ion channel family protein [Panacagrimonas sp.]
MRKQIMPSWMEAWMDKVFLDNTVEAWLTALAIAVAINLVVALVKGIAVSRLVTRAARTQTGVDDAFVTALRATKQFLVFFVSLMIGSRSLELSDRVDLVIGGAATIAAFVQLGLWVSAGIAFWLERSRSRAMIANAAAATSLAAMGFILQTLLWTLVVLLALDNLGINITALVAGLGIGGVAIALAVQNILGDLFASLSIVIDKPFVIGDFIIVDDYMGTVEYVGLKTTRVRSLGGEQIIFPNGDLLKARTRNYKRMIERRVIFSFGLDYDTDPAKLAAVPKTLQAIIESKDKVRFERAHFQKFGASSLDFEVVYWMLDADFNRYMDVQQAINLEMLAAFAEAEILFSFPTQALRMVGPVNVTTSVAERSENDAEKRPEESAPNGRGAPTRLAGVSDPAKRTDLS